MCFQELLALGERIGDVCTGLTEETILSRLKQRNYICIKTEEPEDAEPCCICRVLNLIISTIIACLLKVHSFRLDLVKWSFNRFSIICRKNITMEMILEH